jgi:hypothetical protein
MPVSLVEIAQLKDRVSLGLPPRLAADFARFCQLQDLRAAELEIAKRNLTTRLAEVWVAPMEEEPEIARRHLQMVG